MFRIFIKKFYSFILWTKKWHFFHIIINITGFWTTLLWLYISYYYITNPNEIDVDTIMTDCIIGPVFCLGFFGFLALYIALPFEILIIIIRAIARKPFCVFSSFLNNNKIYNIIYVIFFCVVFLTTLELLLVIK